jgi:hypothetical protein
MGSFSLIRIAVTQVPSSPGLAETLHVLGTDTVFRRINQQLSALVARPITDTRT